MGMRMLVWAIGLLGLCVVVAHDGSAYAGESGVLVLEDFQSADQGDFRLIGNMRTSVVRPRGGTPTRFNPKMARNFSQRRMRANVSRNAKLIGTLRPIRS